MALTQTRILNPNISGSEQDTPVSGGEALAFSVCSAVLVAAWTYRLRGSAPLSLTNVSRLRKTTGS